MEQPAPRYRSDPFRSRRPRRGAERAGRRRDNDRVAAALPAHPSHNPTVAGRGQARKTGGGLTAFRVRRQCARGPTESCLTLAAIKHRGRGKAGGARTVVPGQGGSANGCRWPRGRAAALRVHRGLSSPLYVVGVSFVGTGDRILGCGPRASLDWMDGATELVGRLSTGAWDDEPDACWTILRPIAPSVSAGTTKPMRVGRKQ
jgi:hypothetical protein